MNQSFFADSGGDDAPVLGAPTPSERLGFRAAAIALPLLLLVLAFVGYRLARQGAREFLDSSGGRVAETVTDPLAPGYEAIVESTPVLFVMLTDGDGELATSAIVSQTVDEPGGVVLVLPGVSSGPGTSLKETFGVGGPKATAQIVAELVNVEFDAAVVVAEQGWTELLASIGPVPLDIPDRLVRRDAVGTASLVFESGSGEVQPEFVPLYVGWLNPDEKMFVYLNRQFGFWEALIDSIAVNPQALAGDSEFPTALRTVLGGNWQLREVAYEIDEAASSRAEVALDQDALSALIVDMVPFPRPAVTGGRARVRLLDGVGNREALLDHAATLVQAGAQITVLGNDAEFGLDRTRIVVHDQDGVSWAESFTEALGAGFLQLEPTQAAAAGADAGAELPETIFDVTVVIGNDVSS